MIPPEGYKKLPLGVRCRCVRLWRDPDSADHWCCIETQKKIPAHTEQWYRDRIANLEDGIRHVLAFDWSDNDADAAKTIENLRRLVE